MKSHTQQQPMSVQTDGERVVLTMSPQQAQALASSISTATLDHTEAFDDLVHGLAMTSQPEPSTRMSRGAFLRGRWLTESSAH